MIAQRFPEAHIRRTMTQKSKRHRYYVEETKPVVEFLNELRNSGVVEVRS